MTRHVQISLSGLGKCLLFSGWWLLMLYRVSAYAGMCGGRQRMWLAMIGLQAGHLYD
jgi:hypothetical protein